MQTMEISERLFPWELAQLDTYLAQYRRKINGKMFSFTVSANDRVTSIVVSELDRSLTTPPLHHITFEKGNHGSN